MKRLIGLSVAVLLLAVPTSSIAQHHRGGHHRGHMSVTLSAPYAPHHRGHGHDYGYGYSARAWDYGYGAPYYGRSGYDVGYDDDHYYRPRRHVRHHRRHARRHH